jgi:holo-[acyl-carrier protein] synthase
MQGGVGIDLVSVTEVQETVARFGDRYLSRVFTPREREECRMQPSRLAARLAAKEATMKALRSADGLPWTSIELRDGESRTPTLSLHGAAAKLARQRKVTALSVSLGRGKGQASALVLAQGS